MFAKCSEKKTLNSGHWKEKKILFQNGIKQFGCLFAAYLVNQPYCYATDSFSHMEIGMNCFDLQFIRLCHNNILQYIVLNCIVIYVGIWHAMKWHKLLLNTWICRANNKTSSSNKPWRLLMKICVEYNLKIAIHFAILVWFLFVFTNIALVYTVKGNPFKLDLLFEMVMRRVQKSITQNNKNKPRIAVW